MGTPPRSRKAYLELIPDLEKTRAQRVLRRPSPSVPNVGRSSNRDRIVTTQSCSMGATLRTDYCGFHFIPLCPGIPASSPQRTRPSHLVEQSPGSPVMALAVEKIAISCSVQCPSVGVERRLFPHDRDEVMPSRQEHQRLSVVSRCPPPCTVHTDLHCLGREAPAAASLRARNTLEGALSLHQSAPQAFPHCCEHPSAVFSAIITSAFAGW